MMSRLLQHVSRGVGLGLLAALVSAPAFGYVGPGAGLTLLSALWGLLVAVLAAVAFLVLWPLRRWRRRRQAALQSGAALEAEAAQEGDFAAGENREPHRGAESNGRD